MKQLTLGALLLTVAACAQLPADPSKMSPEQIHEWIKDKNASVSCGKVNTPYGPTVLTYVTLDKAVILTGTVQVDSECKVTISNEAKK